jgi:hypothetical protein
VRAFRGDNLTECDDRLTAGGKRSALAPLLARLRQAGSCSSWDDDSVDIIQAVSSTSSPLPLPYTGVRMPNGSVYVQCAAAPANVTTAPVVAGLITLWALLWSCGLMFASNKRPRGQIQAIVACFFPILQPLNVGFGRK